MKKISQTLLCIIVFAYVSFFCCSSPAEESALSGVMASASGFQLFVKLGQQQAYRVYEPVLSIEANGSPIVGSTLTNIYQAAIEEPDYALDDAAAEPVKQETETKKKSEEKKKADSITYVEYLLPAQLGLRKSLESHTAITSRNSAQYRLQQNATTDDLGLRKYKKRYMVAVGTYFNAPVGAKIDVYLSSGNKLKCIVGDIKSDKDTVGGLTQKDDGSVIEFIVEWRRIDRSCKRLGSMHALEAFDGYVEKVIVYEEAK